MRFAASLLFVLLLATSLPAEVWDQFRGKDGGKLSVVTHPQEWSTEQNVAWAVATEGSGWSSPVVIGDRVFLTSAVSATPSKPKGMSAGVASMRSFRGVTPVKHEFVVSCRSLKTGELLWKKTVAESVPPVVHPSNTYATESPATDGTHLFCFFATIGTFTAWDVDGNELWRRDVGAYKSGNGFGTGSSLAIADGRVFVQSDNDESSFVLAFDCATGEQLWRHDRDSRTSWSTPIVWNNDQQTELVTCGSGVVTSYRPSDGEVLWQLTGMQSAFSGSPAFDADRIIFGNSGPTSAGPLVAVPAGTSGKIELDREFESDKVSWSRTRSGPGMASPVIAKGHIYIPTSGGILNCYDVKTGERAYRNRVDKMATVAASLWADEDRVFVLDEDGTTHVFQTGAEFNKLATNKIDDLFWSTPTIVGDTLLMRGVDKLYCIRQ